MTHLVASPSERHCEWEAIFNSHNVLMTGSEYTFPGNPEGIVAPDEGLCKSEAILKARLFIGQAISSHNECVKQVSAFI